MDGGIGEEGIGSSSQALSSLTCSPTGLRFHYHFQMKFTIKSLQFPVLGVCVCVWVGVWRQSDGEVEADA